MWRGFGNETESDATPSQRSYFRPRISSISGVLAMTKQRLFTSTMPAMKDNDMESTGGGISGGVGHTSHYNLAINPSAGIDMGNGMIMSGGGARYPSAGRSSYGDVFAYSGTASGRPSVDSQTGHHIYGIHSSGDPLAIHDQSDTDGGADNDGGKCTDKSAKILRGITLMLLISSLWVGTLYLLKLSFENEKTSI
ncbi:uncharacterized protein LOC128956098 [Oppia nitens]|uniref:uncharacterized protein LOC128956098 n=1 Tax=Oppia nitens TaxID=1686743 RepID=UPI0023DAA20C|nr:uncharacterized protein LOC128956098 [Oppia nitens]